MVVDPRAATAGTRRRLLWGALTGLLAATSMLCVIVMSLDAFSMLTIAVISAASCLGSIAFLLSARQEELVHQLADQLHTQPVDYLESELYNLTPPPPSPAQADGTL